MVGGCIAWLRFKDEYRFACALIHLRTLNPEERLQAIRQWCPELEMELACCWEGSFNFKE